MDTQTPQAGPFWVRHRVVTIIAGLVMTVVCAVGCILLAVYLSMPSVTPEQERLAVQALANPDQAPASLGHYPDRSRWESPREGDYTVQDGMVIFALPDRQPSIETGIPVLVYAPDGRDLGALPPPPSDNKVKSTDWFLIRCQAVPFHASWWNCGLTFGIWQF